VPFARLSFLFLICLSLSACITEPASYKNYFAKKKIAIPDSTQLQHCRGYGCRFKDSISLAPTDWQKIKSHFHKNPKDAAEERARISVAIGTFEKIVGKASGSDVDLAGTFQSTGNFQEDCVDESINTTSYLVILKNAGLLRFHDILQPTARLWSGWPHQTAVILENTTQEKFAVDSWFHDNGVNAEIIPLALWEAGWSPQRTDDF